MYIDILRVHNDWRGKRSSSDTLKGVAKMRENYTLGKGRERERMELGSTLDSQWRS